MSASPLRVLCVCTGNICRSPVAERLLAARLGSEAVVRSAGIEAVVGHPIHEEMVRLLEADHVNASRFAARQITPAILRSADLILTMTAEHRTRVVSMAPGVVRRTFTLVQFANICAMPKNTDPHRHAASGVPATESETSASTVSAPARRSLPVDDAFATLAEQPVVAHRARRASRVAPLQDIIHHSAQYRLLARPDGNESEDIPDPIGRKRPFFEQTYALIRTAADTIADAQLG